MRKRFSFPFRHKQIYMIPNRFGFIAVGLFLVFSLVAATYSNNLLFLLAFLHVSFLLVCILQTARNLRHIDISVARIPEGFPKELVTAQIKIQNLSKKSKLGLQVRCGTEDCLVTELQPQEHRYINIPFSLPSQRGAHVLDRLRLSTDAPYGLFRGWLYAKIKWTYFVYPAPIGEALPTTSTLLPGGDFSGLREYQLGDPLSRVSWKHSAKNDKLLLKEFNERDENIFLIDWDHCSQNENEARLAQLARWIVDCEKSQRFYALRLHSSESSFHFHRGLSHYHANLLKLAQWQAPS